MKRISKSTSGNIQSLHAFACDCSNGYCNWNCSGCRSGDTATALMNQANQQLRDHTWEAYNAPSK